MRSGNCFSLLKLFFKKVNLCYYVISCEILQHPNYLIYSYYLIIIVGK